MMAYLSMMAIRLIQLHKVLKPTGSLYLHCDPTASHYLKTVMDAIFGKDNYRNEIVWKRTTTHSDSKTWSKVADVLFFYTKSSHFTWNSPHEAHSSGYIADKYRHDDGDGRLYMLDNMTSPNPRPNMMYVWKGFPFPDKGWRYSKETMKRLEEEGRVFCGCGTAVHAAQKLKRKWIGIDITHLAIGLIERRLKDAFPGIAFEVHGTPKDLDGARDLAIRDKYQFQW